MENERAEREGGIADLPVERIVDGCNVGEDNEANSKRPRNFSNCRATTAGTTFFFFFFLPFFHPLPKTSRIVENKKLNATCNARQGFFLRSRRQRKRNMENGAGGGAPTEQKSEWIDTCRTHVQPGVEKNQGTTVQLVHDADLMYRRYRIPPMEMRGCICHHWNVSSP